MTSSIPAITGWLRALFGLSALLLMPMGHAQWQDNLRWSLDFSERYVDLPAGRSANVHTVGLDLHKVVSSAAGDIGTLTLQPYLLYVPQSDAQPGVLNRQTPAVQWRIANFNYTALAQGRFNLRAGHFEVPFGLEQSVQTNGTLYQLNSVPHLALKTDWGVSVNGALQQFVYEVALTQGSANEFQTDQRPQLLSGRFGSNPHQRVVAGLSILDGNVQEAGRVVERQRIGFDVSTRFRAFDVLAEYAVGNDTIATRNSVTHTYLEGGWRNRRESVHTYVQWRRLETQRRPDRRRWSLGTRYEPNRHVSLSGQIDYELANDDPGAQIQMRYRL